MRGFAKFVAAMVLVAAFAAEAALTVEENADGTFRVLRDGAEVVTAIRPVMDREVEHKKSSVTLKDGSRVWNRWNESKGDNFRFEIVQRADGAIEISMLGYCTDAVANRTRAISYTLPGAVFNGKDYIARSETRMLDKTKKGTFGSEMQPVDTRYFTADGLVFNGDATPAANFTYDSRQGICGKWTIKADGKGGFSVSSNGLLPRDGCAEAGDKLVIHPGEPADYAKDHFQPYFHLYHWEAEGARWHPLHLVKFGAPKAGTGYKDGNLAFNGNFGWSDGAKRKVRVGSQSGAYYSHALGDAQATYRFEKLPPGYYILTCQLGNYTGDANDFSITVNGERLAKNISIKKREARTIARTYHVENGRLDVRFDGQWIVSAIGLQPLLSDSEDYMMRRGFWFTEGFEPSICRRNSYTRPFKPATFDQTVKMPIPGMEALSGYCEPPRKIELVDRSAPENKWMFKLNMRNLQLGSGQYYDDDAKRAKFLKESQDLHYNAFMLHGNICRHLMPDEELDIIEREIARFVKEGHEHGIKFIDHVDITLGWAVQYGYRSLIENLDSMMLDVNDNLPTWAFCLENPKWKKRMFDYLRQKVAQGVDGFQLDELCYWRHGCGCAHCRTKFKDETGWQLPLDETDPSCKFRAKTLLYARWREWQEANIGNWRVELRRFTKDLNPSVYTSTYGTYGGQVGRRCVIAHLMEDARSISMLGTEVMQQDVMRCSRPLMTLSRLKNVFRLAYGVNSWNWFYNCHYSHEVFAFGVCSMTGEIPLLTGTWLGAYYDPAFANPVEWAAKSRPMDVENAFPVAEVGLLFSYNSCLRNDGDNCTPEILGLAQELEVMHVPYEFFGDVSCRFEQLKNYKVVFIGESQCLTDAEIGALKAFVANGGKLYGRPGCGTRNEYGELRKEPFDGYRVMSSAKPFYEDEHPERGRDKGPWFVCDPVAEAKFRAEIAGLVKGAEWWKVEGAPDKLYTSVFREKTGDIVLHFLNATGCDIWQDGKLVWKKSKERYPALKEDVFVEVPASCGEKALAYGPELGIEAKPLQVERKGSRLRIRIPKEYLQVYMIVRFR